MMRALMSRAQWRARRARDTLRYEGLLILLWRVSAQCLSPVGTLQPWTFYRRDLSKPIVDMSTPSGVHITLADESDADRLAALVARRYGPTPLGPYAQRGIYATIVHRLRRGLKCFVARVGREIVHYNWLAFEAEDSLGDAGALIVLRADEAYCSDAYTVETWRGRGIHTVVLRQMLIHAKEAGYRSIYTDVGSDNKSSWKAHERLGWEWCGTALDFTPRGTHTTWRWRVRGGPNPFAATAGTFVSFTTSQGSDPRERQHDRHAPR
jgi:GNAT superfamily N-acetyltransferase